MSENIFDNKDYPSITIYDGVNSLKTKLVITL